MEEKNNTNTEVNSHTNENFIVVKARFKSISMNLYGQMLLSFKTDKSIDLCNIVVSTFSDAYDLEPHANWDKYEETIADNIWKGNYNQNITSSLMDQFKKIHEEHGQLDLLYSNAYNYDYDNLDITLFDLINRIIHDKNLILESGIQEITKKDIESVRNKRVKSKKEESVIKDEEGSVILPIKAIVAPVRGKPIYELKIGDKIMVKIQPNTDRANYFIDLLNLRDDNGIKPTPAEVIDLKSSGGKNDTIEILTQLGPGIFGKITEDEKQVKLRVYDPIIDGSKPTTKKTSNQILIEPDIQIEEDTKANFSKSLFLIFIVFFVILAVFIFLIFISW